MTVDLDTDLHTDECFRCGYLLHGIANDQACPECGLLAERSRRLTDELHETRPKWLRGLFFGVVLILLSIPLAIAWAVIASDVMDRLYGRWGWTSAMRAGESGFVLVSLMLFLGVVFLTRPEHYEPADRADRRLRILLLLGALVPMMAVAFPVIQTEVISYRVRLNRWFYRESDLAWMETAAAITSTLGTIPLPLLLFLRLRGLAKRARSAHLAEHCLIVGTGTSVSLLYVFGVYEVMEHAERWGLGTYWTTTSRASLVIMLLMTLAASLFILWSIYLMVRFAIAFFKAWRQRRRNWRRDDRSLPVPAQP